MAKIRSEVMSRRRSDSMVIGVRCQCRRVGRSGRKEGRLEYKISDKREDGT